MPDTVSAIEDPTLSADAPTGPIGPSVRLSPQRARPTALLSSPPHRTGIFFGAIFTVIALLGSVALAIFATFQAAPYLMGVHMPPVADTLRLAGLSAAITALLVLPIAMIRGRRSAINALKPFLKLPTDLEAASQSDYPQLGRYQTTAANDVATAINRLSADLRDRDIELEARRRKLDHDVEHRMAEIKDVYADMKVSLAEAERVRREAERANHAKSDFLAKMSHEIRTPLNGILGAMDLMLNTGLTPRQQNYATTIRASGTTLLDLLNGILDLAKIESGEVTVAKTEYDPTVMLDDIAIAFAPSASGKGLHIVSMPDPDLPHCLAGDSARVRQVVVNLVGNAVKFTASGSVAISAEWIEGSGESDGRLDIDISDTGPGVPAAARDRIFERFEQGDGSMSRKFGGAGLGLAIARDLARRMGGDVTLVRSERGGSTFRLSVPAMIVVADPPTLQSNLFVLAAEATPDEQQSLLGRLARRGVESAEAQGAAQAAAMLEGALGLGERIPDVIITSGDDEQGLKRLRTRLLKITGDARPKLCILTEFGSDPVADELTDVVDWAMMRPLGDVDLGSMLQALANGSEAAEVVREPFNLNILMAEDNPVNVLVTEGLLEDLGCTVTIAENGLAAADAAAEQDFDLILMDCQMPIMDGYEATRQIRAMEDGTRPTPIIAVTANSFAEDRDACFEAGMTDFLAKPVTNAALIQILKPHAIRLNKIQPDTEHDRTAAVRATLGSAAVRRDVVEPPALAEIKAKQAAMPHSAAIADDGFPEALDYDVIQSLRKVGRDGDKMVQRVIDTFLKSSPTLAENISAAAKVGDLTAAGRNAHALKSASGNVGSRALPTILTDIEAMAKAGDGDGVQQLADEVNTAFDDLTMALKTLKARG